jgi:hypothetical protein
MPCYLSERRTADPLAIFCICGTSLSFALSTISLVRGNFQNDLLQGSHFATWIFFF